MLQNVHVIDKLKKVNLDLFIYLNITKRIIIYAKKIIRTNIIKMIRRENILEKLFKLLKK